MTRVRTRRLTLGSLLIVALIGLALAQALRDTTPPTLWVEGPERVAAGEAFELFVSADEPARYRIVYGEAVVEAVEQEYRHDFTALPGEQEASITAVDAAGNESDAVHAVEGIVIPRARLTVPAELRPGDPYTVAVTFDPAGAARAGLAVRAGPEGGAPVLHRDPQGAYAFGVVPLGTEPGTMSFEARWRDGLGRDAVAAAATTVVPLGQEIEQLHIAPATLAVITPDGRALEEAALATVRPDPSAPPAWSEPFLAPIDGRGTSGFGSPRRYVVGGPVSFHTGEDIAAPTGTPIRATNDGVVVLAGPYPIKGGLTIIDHGAGLTSRYFHQSAIHVEAGQSVERGAAIGEVGSTGLSTGPHLHWEMWLGEVPSYPMAWLDTLRP